MYGNSVVYINYCAVCLKLDYKLRWLDARNLRLLNSEDTDNVLSLLHRKVHG